MFILLRQPERLQKIRPDRQNAFVRPHETLPTLLGTTRFVPSGRSLRSIFSKFQTSRFKKLGFWKSPEGKLVELAEYCCYDVKITKLLHEYGCKNREVFYKN